MKKYSQPIELHSGQSDQRLGQDGAMLSKSDLNMFADLLWMPSANEDAHFENMRRQNAQSGTPKTTD